MATPPRPEPSATRATDDLERTLASLRTQAEALAALQRRCAELRDRPERTFEQLDAVVSAIDVGIDACLLIAEHAAAADPGGSWEGAATELERQLRRLAVLRAQVLTLYVSPATARSGS